MNKKTLLLISTLLAPAMSHGGWFDAVTLSTGGSEDFDTPVRIGLRGDIDTRWFESGTGYLSAYYELALNHFSDSDRAATAISFSPVLVYRFTQTDRSAGYWRNEGARDQYTVTRVRFDILSLRATLPPH